jgi:decaprenylphospho-beta-D-erythro-pentofuranosid-2-ulose 2-reductase
MVHEIKVKVSIMKKYTIIFGATSLIAQNIAREFYRKHHNLILIARNRKKLSTLSNKLKKNKKNDVLTFVTSLKNENEIKKSFDWILKKQIKPNLIFICPGVIFNDKDKILIDDYIDSIFINAILPMFIFKAFFKNKSIKIITLGSIFSSVPMKNKLFYSYSKKLFSLFFDNLFLNKTKGNYLFKLGPMYTPMYKGPKRIYVSSPSSISKQIIKIVESEKGGVYYLPKFWMPLLPFLFIFNLL